MGDRDRLGCDGGGGRHCWRGSRRGRGRHPEGELAEAVHSRLQRSRGADPVACGERAGRERVPGQVTENTDGGDRNEWSANDQDDSRNRA
jgi:hypothetical protein